MKIIFQLIGITLLFFSCKNDKSKVSEKLQKSLEFNNPIITEVFTADPAAIVHNDTVYLYAGHDEAPNDFHFYKMNEWLVFSSTNMVDWKSYPVPLKPSDFSWAIGDAWASQVIEKNEKFYWYVTVEHDKSNFGKAIGVAVSDSPTGPFKDALGKALVTNDMTKATKIHWDDIDPSVFIDDDGQAYLFWGNTACYYAKLKDNMIVLDGEIKTIE
ncbi:family 43 glycosylhydrolase, partial [Polaribacter sp.]|uniref:family 43 glycosylhydrolase n=1 Tax=Polaribacter sp. TaxID=1920175 RepID=UPI003F6CAAAA